MALALAGSASAAMVRTGETYSLNVNESVGENLYVGSSDINISGNVHGDLTAAGGNITVTGENSRDVMLAGGSVKMLGPVSDDLRILGGDLTLGKNVGGDLMAIGGKIHLLPEAYVSGEFLAVGGDIILDGTVARDFAAVGGKITINGTVLGNVRIRNVQSLTLGENAVIKGNLEYASANDAVVASGAKIGKETRHTPAPDWGRGRKNQNRRWVGMGDGGFFDVLSFIAHIMSFLAYLAATVLAVRFFGGFLQRHSEEMRSGFWKEALRGFLVTIAVPLLMLALALTLIGLPLTFFVGLIYAGVWGAAKIFAAVSLGAWVRTKFSMTAPLGMDWRTAIVGTVSLFVLKAIPVIGWIPLALLLFASFGQLSKESYLKGRELFSK